MPWYMKSFIHLMKSNNLNNSLSIIIEVSPTLSQTLLNNNFLLFVIRSYVPLPKLTPEGYRVFVFRIFDSSLASKISALHILKSVQMLMEWSIKQDKHKGVIVLFDIENISVAYIRVGFKVLRKLLAIETVGTQKMKINVEFQYKRNHIFCQV